MQLTKKHKAGFKLVTSHIKGKYPFVIEVIPRFDEIKKYGSLMGVDIKFNLNKFYDVTNTTPPKHYIESPFLMDLLKDKGPYLFKYVNYDYRNKFESEFNYSVEWHINEYYKRLPEYMRLNSYYGWTDEELQDYEESNNYRQGWIKEMFWDEALKMSITDWIPVFDETEYKSKNKSNSELTEEWSEKYKRSIDCNNPKGFSQRAHCQGRKKKDLDEYSRTLKMARRQGSGTRFSKPAIKSNPMRFREYSRKINEDVENDNLINMILRRLNPEDLEIEFKESLDIALNIYRNKHSQDLSLAQFRNTVISSTIDGIHADLISTLPNDVQWYDNVFYTLRSLFDDRIEEKFNELKEKKELPNFLKRRFTEDEINFEFEDALEYTNGLFERIYSRQERTLENYISLTIRVLMDNLHPLLTIRIGEDVEWYGRVENILKDYYKDEITKEYKSIMK